ncbi:hypothetical protein DPMN_062028 [Dreissena polymorpha]|uniref:Uncharacterized protein n=1 Tax=Dreissena polymorpha TaxID=45954 RepID=A0A9D4HJS6_DREPO|nr:hypothetical protein DPMN_062028 [Dreissena polymorpha]
MKSAKALPRYGSGQMDGRKDRRTDNAKTISLRLWRGITKADAYPHAAWLVMGPCIVEIDRIVIREVQYQLEVNRCRNEEIIVKGYFGWVWPMWEGCPRIDRIFQGSSANSVGGDSGQDRRTDRHTDGGDNHNIPTLFKKAWG